MDIINALAVFNLAQISESAVARFSKLTRPAWQPAAQQVWKHALQVLRTDPTLIRPQSSLDRSPIPVPSGFDPALIRPYSVLIRPNPTYRQKIFWNVPTNLRKAGIQPGLDPT